MRRWAAPLAAVLALSGCSTLRFYGHYARYYLSGPPPVESCGEGPGFRYCLYHPPKGEAEDAGSVLYFLHYAEGDERSWGRIPLSRVFYDEFRRRGIPAPRVATVSFGPYWTLFDKPGPLSPGRFGPFVAEVMPWLEERLGHPGRRYLWGLSQGGFNASLLVLKRPDLWAGAVLSCPAWHGIDLFSAKEEIAAYARKNGASAAKVEWGMGLIKHRIEGPSEWAREDPLTRARSASGLPPLSIDAGAHDEFAFQLGARAMVAILKERGQRVTYREDPGGHCEVDGRAAASYLAALATEVLAGGGGGAKR